MKALVITFALAVGMGSLKAQPAEKVKIEDLQKMVGGNSGKIQVLNFWATWCAPCIKELPLFEQMNATRKDIEISLVSIDLDLDPNPDKIYRFIDRKKLKSKVYILDERDPNTWIDKIDKSWSGAIPATLVVNLENGKRRFVEKELKEGDLEEIIDSVK
ncbi:MAG: TlpA disulfide reductase family protein [Cyclobacteriaceae bacterium]